MKHHFTLTFRMAERQPVDVDRVANKMSGSDFQIEAESLNGAEFNVHFIREGNNATELLDFAREQVIRAVPGAELISMDMSEEPPMVGAVDDITKLVIQACQIFSDPDQAHAWLNSPQASLQGRVPKAVMVDAEGRTLVSRVLVELESKP